VKEQQHLNDAEINKLTLKKIEAVLDNFVHLPLFQLMMKPLFT